MRAVTCLRPVPQKLGAVARAAKLTFAFDTIALISKIKYPKLPGITRTSFGDRTFYQVNARRTIKFQDGKYLLCDPNKRQPSPRNTKRHYSEEQHQPSKYVPVFNNLVPKQEIAKWRTDKRQEPSPKKQPGFKRTSIVSQSSSRTMRVQRDHAITRPGNPISLPMIADELRSNINHITIFKWRIPPHPSLD